ncbi:TonB-dependent receptor domain-containing protein [Psychroserpens ponticola]|uniref:Outer membrane beta-barrel family protein n=1 Tax=Psychroserpens ponticola TaxID=2932268 RepID=A0ABY7RYB0_9FLAO|nr:outer membrane beta-barrel family protein [Psychroserpens ponticola]WCO01700.1 outer membrane beta-barrel family protein [Psychroserpens ponticola]
MKSLLNFTFILLCSLLSYGQSLSVSGTIIDIDKNPIEFANVIILNEDESEILKGISTDDNGFFNLINLAPNTYILKISYIGFEDFNQKIVLTGHLDLRIIELNQVSESLDEVSILVKKPTIKREADRLVFNIEKTALVEGNMLQVLKSTPGVLVIGDEITVKNTNPTVYINNRKVNLSSEDLNQLLTGSSANAIKSVEVITNPSARYDAESGVVINIVMSKNLITGYRGSVFANYTQGVFPNYTAGTSHFFKNEDISLNVNYSYSKDKVNRDGDDTVNFLNNSNLLNQSWQSLSNRNTWSETHNINANFDYFINESSTLSVSSNALYIPYFKYKIASNNIISDVNGDFLSRFTADNLSRDNKYNLAFDIDFSHSFTKGELAVNAHYTTYNYERNQSVISNAFDINNSFLNASAFNTNNNQDTNIFAGKIDYSLPIDDSSNFETGLKFSRTNAESDITQFDVDLNTGNETIDALNSDAFNYDETIFAAYVNYDMSIEKWSVNAGLRVEQTNIKGNSPLTNISNTQDYFEWFPNASLQYSISDNYNVYVNYKRSIARPSYAALNPFQFFLNDNYVVSGNPFLQPTFTDHIKVGTNITDYFTFEAYYQNFDGAISEVPRQNNNTNDIEYISVNFDKTVEFGFDFITNFDLTNRWSVYAVTSFYNLEEETDFGQGFVTQDQWSNYSELQNDFTLLKDNSLNISFVLTWVGKNLQGFQVVDNRLFSEFAVSKSILNKKGIISLSVSDLFNMHDYDLSTKYQNQSNRQFVDIDNRYIRLGFRYKFGNTKLNSNARAIDTEERDRLEKKTK